MFITRHDILFLKNIASTKNAVAIDTIPTAFKADFQLFFLGKTFFKEDNVLFAYPQDVKKWAYYMFDKYSG